MAIKPQKFGPYFWGVLHLACLGGIDPVALRTLVSLFPAILPCGACGQHFAEVLAESPIPETNDPDVLFRWSVDVHNTVNKKIEKPVFSYEEALKIWLSMPAEPEPPKKTNGPLIMFALTIVALMAVLIWKIRS